LKDDDPDLVDEDGRGRHRPADERSSTNAGPMIDRNGAGASPATP
jgi:hypothetical protein